MGGVRFCHLNHCDFSESRFLLGALHRRSKFENFCHDIMQNHLFNVVSTYAQTVF